MYMKTTPVWILTSSGPKTPAEECLSLENKNSQHLVKSPHYLNPNIPSASSHDAGRRPEENLYLLFVNTDNQRNPNYESYGLGTVYTCMQTHTNTPHRIHTLITMWCKQSATFGVPIFTAGMYVPDRILFHVGVRISVIFVALP